MEQALFCWLKFIHLVNWLVKKLIRFIDQKYIHLNYVFKMHSVYSYRNITFIIQKQKCSYRNIFVFVVLPFTCFIYLLIQLVNSCRLKLYNPNGWEFQMKFRCINVKFRTKYFLSMYQWRTELSEMDHTTIIS